MAVMGLPLDVNNTIFSSNAYPFGRSYGMLPNAGSDFSYRNNYAGEIGGLNQDYLQGAPMLVGNTTNPTMSPNGAMANPGAMTGQYRNGAGQQNPKPAHVVITVIIMLVVISFLARRYAPSGEQFALIKPNLINGVFLTLFIVAILALLKQAAIRVRHVPIIGSAADVILSV
jgi:hypothetical protein